MMQSRIS